MHFSQKMQSLAVLTFFACIAVIGAAEKESVCCREASIQKITVPITGFKIQAPRPPCVKAVIFYTAEGAKCSHWKEDWVRNKVFQLRKLQAKEKSRTINTTTIAPQTTGKTYTINTISTN